MAPAGSPVHTLLGIFDELGSISRPRVRASEARPLLQLYAAVWKASAHFPPLASLSCLLPLTATVQHGQPGPVKSPAHGSLVSGDTCLAFWVAARVHFCSIPGLIHGLGHSQKKNSEPLFTLRADNFPQQRPSEAGRDAFSEET